MPRRTELKGVCHDLLETFTSRNNDLDGYWALGKMQSYLQRYTTHRLRMDLLTVPCGEPKQAFPEVAKKYKNAFLKQLVARGIRQGWVQFGHIEVQAVTPQRLRCRVCLKTDLGKEYVAEEVVMVRPHYAHASVAVPWRVI